MILGYLFMGMLFMLSITRPFIVLLHELGHALPALLATKYPVTIYIGSYGDPKNSLQVRLGRLTIWFRYSLFWRTGLCVAEMQDQPRWVKLVFILGGPLMSSILAGLCTYIIFNYNLHGALKLYIEAFLAFAIFDLLVNLIPDATPIHLHNGKVGYNDGYKLKMLLYYGRFSTDFDKAIALYEQQEYRKAATLFEHFLAYHLRNEDIYRLAISCRISLREHTTALALHAAYAAEFDLSVEDYITSGYLKDQLGRSTEALADYDRALQLDPLHHVALNNKGYALNVLGQYAEAIPYLDQSIQQKSDYAFAYNNRGLAKIKTNCIPEGLADIQHSLSLAPQNAYAYRNLGIYYLEQNQFDNAKEQFELAYKLDPHTDLLPELVAYAQQCLEPSAFINA